LTVWFAVLAVCFLLHAGGEDTLFGGENPTVGQRNKKPSVVVVLWRTFIAKVRRKKQGPEVKGYEQLMQHELTAARNFDGVPTSPLHFELIAGFQTPSDHSQTFSDGSQVSSDDSDRRTPRNSPCRSGIKAPPPSPASPLLLSDIIVSRKELIAEEP